MTGEQFKQIQRALLSAFPDPESLQQMVKLELKLNLHEVADDGNLVEITFQLISWAESNGRLRELIEAALRSNPRNPDLMQLGQVYRTWDLDTPGTVLPPIPPEPSNKHFGLWIGTAVGVGLLLIAVYIFLQRVTPSDGPGALASGTPTAAPVSPALGVTPIAAAAAPVSPTSGITPTAEPAAPVCPDPPIYAADTPFDSLMAEIPGGSFDMGGEDSGELEHKVTLAAYRIDKYEVTNLQYQRCVEAGYCRPPAFWTAGKFHPAETFAPVSGVAWEDALAYCTWVGKRLPTEAEWEYACSGGQDTTYPWGNAFDLQRANAGLLCKGSAAVGSFSPAGDSPAGIADLLGNVDEWIASMYLPYPFQQQPSLSPGQEAEAERSVRGGSFAVPLAGCAVRAYAPPDTQDLSIGFRCAQTVQ